MQADSNSTAADLELKKYENCHAEKKLLDELKQQPDELVSFFLYPCEDETWTESHSSFMQGIFLWI